MADFIIDDSIQTTTVFSQGSIFTTKTNPNLRLSSTAGLYYPSENNFRVYTNSIDALTIDSNQILYGNGAGFTNLNYNNITGKPTNFQCDYNSTLINKPTNFQCDYNSTLINKPTNFQCDYNSTLINKPTNFQSDYNSTLINKPDLTFYITSNFVLSNYISSNVLNSTLSIYDTINLRNTALGSYTTTSALTTLLSGKEANLTFNTPLTRSVNTISLDLSSYDTIALRNTALGSYTTTSALTTLLSGKEASLTFNTPSTRSVNTISLDLSSYDTIALRNTALGSYTTTSALTTLLSGKEASLTFNTPLTRSVNTISLDLSSYDTIALRNTALGSYTTTSALTTLLSAKEASLTFSAPLTRTTNTIGIDLSSYATTTTLGSYLPLTGGTITGNIVINATNSAFFFGGAGGAAVGQASVAGAFSSSSLVGDCIVRCQATKQLILQSGAGAGAIIINSGNNTKITGTINANGNSLIFPNTLSDFKITLYNGFGFGIQANELKYTSGLNHKFYTVATNTFTIDGSGNTSSLGSITAGTNIVSTSGISTFKSIYITNPNNSVTHLPYTNGENYIRGKVNIDQDDLHVGGATNCASTLNVGGLLRHRPSFNYGETLTYTVNFNGGNQSGWFWTTYSFWDGFGTVSYLTIAINATGNGAVWFGRAFLGAGGDFYSIIQDYRTPDGPINTISVVDYWGQLGANTLRISIANPVYGGDFVIKVS